MPADLRNFAGAPGKRSVAFQKMSSQSVVARLTGRSGGAFLLLFAAGCGGQFVGRGTDLYSEGRYIEAAEVFERTEARLANADTDVQARFGLYRGATFLKLQDLEHAARWLGYARSVVRRHPGALNHDERALLDASLAALARERPVAPRSAAEPRVAVRRDEREHDAPELSEPSAPE
jgi:hypothetical protein